MMLALWAAVTFAAVLARVVERRPDDPLGAEHRDRLDRDAGVLADPEPLRSAMNSISFSACSESFSNSMPA